MANDLDRRDWRTYRVDRIARVRPTGARFVIDEPPDAAALVAEGVAVRAYEQTWTVRFHAPLEYVRDEISAVIGLCRDDPEHPGCTLVEIGGDVDWVARFVVGSHMTYEPVGAPELEAELRKIGEAPPGRATRPEGACAAGSRAGAAAGSRRRPPAGSCA